MTGGVALVLGLALLGGAVLAMVRRIRFLATAVTGTAAVTRIRESQTPSNSEHETTIVTVYHSSFRFVTSDGAVHVCEHDHGTSQPPFAVGEQVAIRYGLAAPAKTAELPYLRYELRNWFFMIMAGIFGLAALVGGLGTLLKR